MDKERTTTRLVLVAVATAVLLSGCGTTNKVGNWLRGKDDTGPNDSVIIGAPNAETYINELYELSTGDARKQASIFDDASDTASLTPGPSSTLRLALVLATPGHPQSNAARAAELLRQVLDQEPLLTTAELSLATIYLESAELLAATTTEAAQLRDANTRAARASETEASRRIAAIEAENRRLREALADAEQKLEAITTIERSIRE
jgi:protein-disulfide isomerase